MHMNNHMHRALQVMRKKEREKREKLEKGRERKLKERETQIHNTCTTPLPSPQLHRNEQNCSPNVPQTLMSQWLRDLKKSSLNGLEIMA